MKLKLKNDELLALESLLDSYLSAKDYLSYGDDRDWCALLAATLQELYLKLRQTELIAKKQYTLKLRPTWAFALRVAFAGMINPASFTGNFIRKICDDVDKEFSLLIKKS